MTCDSEQRKRRLVTIINVFYCVQREMSAHENARESHQLDCGGNSRLKSFTRHPQSGSVKQLKQIVHWLVKATERDGECLSHVAS